MEHLRLLQLRVETERTVPANESAQSSRTNGSNKTTPGDHSDDADLLETNIPTTHAVSYGTLGGEKDIP